MSQEELEANQDEFEKEFMTSVDEMLEQEKETIKKLKVDSIMIKSGLMNKFISAIFPKFLEKLEIGIYAKVNGKEIFNVSLFKK